MDAKQRWRKLAVLELKRFIAFYGRRNEWVRWFGAAIDNPKQWPRTDWDRYYWDAELWLT